ncbi:MAG: type II toxin-antitoxin system PemK/MazF family toxin [Hydrogenovibrio sp.]
MVSRCDVYWVELDPALGTEIRKTRPCLVVSPDDMNAVLTRVIIAPITSKSQPLGCRPEVVFKGKKGRILLDQVRTVDKKRLKDKMGSIPLETWHDTLIQMLS